MILWLRRGLEPHEVAYYRAFPIPIGEVGIFFTLMRLTTNLMDGQKPFAEDGVGKQKARRTKSCQSGVKCLVTFHKQMRGGLGQSAAADTTALVHT